MKEVQDSPELQKVMQDAANRKLVDQFSYSRPEAQSREGLRDVLDLRYDEHNKVMHSHFRDDKQATRFAIFKAYNAAEDDDDLDGFCDVFEETWLDARAALQGGWNEYYARILNSYAGMQQEVNMEEQKELISGGVSKFKQFLSKIF